MAPEVPAVPAELQVGTYRLKIDKDLEPTEKGTLTGFFKKKQENMSNVNDEVIDLIADNLEPEKIEPPEGNQEMLTPAGANPRSTVPETQDLNCMEIDTNAQEVAAPDAGPREEQKDKKRKRSTKTPEQIAALEALFALKSHPTTEERRTVGAQIGLDLNAVTNWFEGKRRKRTSAGSKKNRQEEDPTTANNEASILPSAVKEPATQPPPEPSVDIAVMADADTSKAPPSAAAVVTLPDAAARLAELTAEETTLREKGLADPLCPIPTSILNNDTASDGAPKQQPEPYSDVQLALYIAGQRLPLSLLVDALLPLFGPSQGSTESLTREALRSRIVDLAMRKSHDPVDNAKGAPPRLDSLEAMPIALWQWELRDPKILPKARRAEAASIKKRASKVGDRLGALLHAKDVLTKYQAGTATATKAIKALDSLQKHAALEDIEKAQVLEKEAALAKQSEKEAVKASVAAAKMEEKQKAAAEREAEKERIRLEKEAEKERIRLEKERKQKEVEAAKLAKKTGFKDEKILNKTANKFMGFFKAAQPSKNAHSNLPLTSVPGDADAPVELSAYERRFRKPILANIVPQPVQPLKNSKIDTALSTSISFETAECDWKAFIRSKTTARKAAKAAPITYLGLPPSWARKPGAIEVAKQRLQECKENNTDPSTVPTWRRKFIYFPSDSQRPPYYGSWHKPGSNIGPRRYLGRDETLDYEVMSDEDWEEEPEGSSLSNADDEDDAVAQGDDDEEMEDSFMVADGYLSEGEGAGLDDDGDSGDVDECDMMATLQNAQPDSTYDIRSRALKQLKHSMERAYKYNKTLIIIRPDVAAIGADTQATAAATAANNYSNTAAASPGHAHALGCLQGDAAALEALAMEVLIPGLIIQPPQLPSLEESQKNNNVEKKGGREATTAGEGLEKSAAAGGAGRPKIQGPDELIPDLCAFIQIHATYTKQKIIDGFIEAHPNHKMTKKWVGDKMVQMAERKGNKWMLKSDSQDSAAKFFVDAAKTPAAAVGGGLLTSSSAGGGIVGTTIKPTPAVPTALRPAAPTSHVKVPERLVTDFVIKKPAAPPAAPPAAAPRSIVADKETTTANTAATTAVQASLPPLTVPTSVQGTEDDFWTVLLKHIEAETAEVSFVTAFRPVALTPIIAGLPAFILDALVANALSIAKTGNQAHKTKAIAAIQCIHKAVDALAGIHRGDGQPNNKEEDEATPSQRAWGDARSGSHVASLENLCRDPALMELLSLGLVGTLGPAAITASAGVLIQLAPRTAIKELSADTVELIRKSLNDAVSSINGNIDNKNSVMSNGRDGAIKAALAAWTSAFSS